jgi:Flp pilus assembly pilin Flp
MRAALGTIWNEEDGVLAFEWTILVTLVTIGVVSGLAGARDAVIDELGDAAQAMMALDQSYTIDHPLAAVVHAETASGASDAAFEDAALYTDCDRTFFPNQTNSFDIFDDFDS